MIFLKNKKYAPVIILIILLIAISGVVFYGVFPLRQSLSERMKGIQEFYAERENRERQVQKLPELQGQYDNILANEKTLDILITEDRVVSFVKILEESAAEMNVEMSIASKDEGKIVEAKKAVTKVAQTNSTGEDAVTEKANTAKNPVTILSTLPFDRYLALSITVAGQYDNIVAFLGKLETLPFGLDVIRVEMKRQEHAADGNAMKSTNPFVVSGTGGTNDTTQSAPQVAQQDVLEAVFDIIVYVKKN